MIVQHYQIDIGWCIGLRMLCPDNPRTPVRQVSAENLDNGFPGREEQNAFTTQWCKIPGQVGRVRVQVEPDIKMKYTPPPHFTFDPDLAAHLLDQ